MNIKQHIKYLKNKLEHISELPDNWNNYDSKKFNSNIINNGKEFIEYIIKEHLIMKNENTQTYWPVVFPTGRNSLQFEYESDNKNYLEIEVFSDSYNVYYTMNGNDNLRDNIQLNTIKDLIHMFYKGK